MSVFYDLNKTPRNILNQAIVRAIASENNGALFDPSDLSTLYQDAAGTIPVTAVEQPVGLMLDKSRGMMLGPEKISDVDFDNASSWVVDAGFVVSGGKLTINNSVAGNCYQTSTNITSKVFSVTIKIDSLSSGYFLARLCGQNGIALNSAGVYKFLLRSGTINSFIGVQAAPNTVAVIDSISVREIYGYHSTQSITASRPTLSARKNILLATEALATQSVTTLAAQYTLSFTGAGSVTLSGTATGTLTGTGTDRVSLTFTPTAGPLTLTVSGSVTKAQLELGAVAGQYQRVTTSTDYDTDERYFPKYLRFDGVDDYLNLPYMGLYANGSASVVAGINGHQFGKAYNGRIICESLVSANAPTYAPLIQIYTANTTNTFITNNAATILANIGLGLTQNNICTISIVDGGNSIKSFRNAVQKVSATYTRSGTVTLDSTTIGNGINNGSAEIWQGDLYGLIITKSALTDSQRIACERYLGRKSGVQL